MDHGSFDSYREFLIILGVAGVIVPAFVRIGVSSILVFLLVGILLSPMGLPALGDMIPFADTLALNQQQGIAALGELGVVFLMFLIGLELSLERLLTMRRLVFGLGGLQVVLTTAALTFAAVLLGLPLEPALVLGSALSLSSTAIVVQILSETKRLGSQTGRVSFAILLLQDLAVIPNLMLVSLMNGSAEGPLLATIGETLARAALAIVVIILVGRFVLRPLLRAVAQTRSSDSFMAATLLIAVGTGVAASVAGLSMALGAFIAGLMLAETEYRRAIESIIEPFKGLLLGAFFLVVGLGIDLRLLAETPVRIALLVVALIAIKVAIIYALVRAFGINHRTALKAAFLLGPCGEFAFVVIRQAEGAALDAPLAAEATLVVTLTLIALPLLARLSERFASRAGAAPVPVASAEPPPDDHQPRVIVAGFGRVGHLIGAMLDEHKIPYIAVDADADLVSRERRQGLPVYYGDAANPAFLRSCGIAEARALAVTMDNAVRVNEVIKTARLERGDLKIVARARDERHAMALYELGVTEAVPETVESSLQLGEALLVETGVPMGLAIASVHERRDSFRKLLGRPNRRVELDSLRKRRKPRIS